MAHIDYYFTVLSPFAYLAGKRLEDIAAKHGAKIAYKPVDIMTLFSEMGGTPPAQRHDSRKAYRIQELKRLSKKHGLDLNLAPAHWPTDQKPASAMVVAADMAGQDAGALAFAIMRAVWAEEKDIADAATLAAIAEGAGIDLAALQPHLDAGVEAFGPRTQEAMAKGVFGSPFYVVGDELFWGQDRLDDLDTHLGGA
jgi:2-hydroxychromene-2-carboxylate isomerase